MQVSKLMSSVPVECFPYGVEPQTGVCLGLRLGPYRILLDCGLADISGLLADELQSDAVVEHPSEQQPADFVVCSQAHADHVRGLGALRQSFPKTPIYISLETQQILSHLEADPWASECNPIAWNTPFNLTSDLSLELIPAGQMPGAAVCLLTYTAKAEIGEVYTVAYTGDFYLTHTRFAPALSTASFKDRRIDLLIVKGGYGTLQHLPRKQQESELVQALLQALAAQQSIVIPVPQVGLGQELLMLIRTNAEFARQQVTVWVDETVAQGCDAYGQILASLPASIQNFARQQSLFWQATGQLQIQPLGVMTQLPCILLVHHQTDLGQYAQALGEQVLVLDPIPPQSPQALREHPQDAKGEPMSLPASWQRQTFLLAQACDGPSTTQLIHNSRPRHVAFYHRSPLVVEDLMQIPDLQNRYQLHPLIPGERLKVGLAESASLPQEALAPPLQTYRGELVESGLSVTLSLGANILEDPRWQTFADTGLIEAVWQGHQLVIRGLSQAEILRSSASQHPVDRTCCANCHYYRNQRCWQTDSALYGFKVSPQGTCPVYAPIGDRSGDLEPGSEDFDDEGVDV